MSNNKMSNNEMTNNKTSVELSKSNTLEVMPTSTLGAQDPIDNTHLSTASSLNQGINKTEVAADGEILTDRASDITPGFNPYQSPTSAITPQSIPATAYNNSKWYHLSGRIGRLRYMAYQMVMALLMYVVLAISIGLAFRFLDFENISEFSVLIMLFLLYIPLLPFLFYGSIIYPRRRLHDLNQSGWWLLLVFIPFANIIFILFMLFARGNDGANQYGQPPRPNRTIHYIAAFSLPVIFIVLGILIAVFAPNVEDSFDETVIEDVAAESAY